ncbi:MAG: serine/threonine-protein kinase, partial [Planctomycetota bacterium]
MTPDELDNLFFDRATARGLMNATAVGDVRSELTRRREGSPSLTAAEVAIEKGLMGAEAAMALMGADPNESVAELIERAESSAELASLPADLGIHADDEEPFAEVPAMVEPLAPTYAVSDSSDSQELQMELDPPKDTSGDSLFEEDQQVISLDTDSSSPKIVSEDDDPETIMEIPAMGGVSDDMVHPAEDMIPVTDTVLEPDGTEEVGTKTSLGEPTGKDSTARSPRAGDTATDEVAMLQDRQVPEFNKATKGATQDFGSFVDENVPVPGDDDSDNITDSLHDSAVSEVMEQADDGYFGPAADLTVTPPELLESAVLPTPDELEEQTLYDSQTDKEKDFVATAPPESEASESQPVSEVRDNSDFDVSVTLPGEFPTDAKTIVDESDVSLEEITNDSAVSSSTRFATGEQVSPGLGNKGSQLGVESNITDGEIEGREMTLADIRAEMGIGNGVKVGQGAVDRLKAGGGAKRRYSVVREIARGGMGKVMEVEDNDLRRPVALKVLRKEMLGRKDLVERFLEEAQITGQLEHPNIVPVHEIGVDGRGNLYFTMKMVEGEELASIIKRLRKADPGAANAWPITRLIEIFMKICEGIAFAHNRGVIHRDLKPANVMVGRFGEVQIMDWGVAKIIGRKEETADRVIATDRQDDDANKTMVGSILGTPSYMSPEQARGEVDSMGGESDVFALGVILYELLALCTPWTAQTSAQVLDQVKHFDPELPSARKPDRKIPPELERLAMKCLEKEPHKRIRDVQDLVDNLRSWQEGRTLAAVEYSLAQLTFKWLSRHKTALFVVFLLIAGASAAGFFAYKQAKQAGIDNANDNIAVANGKVTDARDALNAGDLEKAIALSSEAMPLYFAAENTFEEETDEIKQGKENALNVSTSANIKKAEIEDAARKKREAAAKEQEIADQLATANELKEAAETLDKSDADDEAVKTAYREAESAFGVVLSIDETNKEADDALDEIKAWLTAFDSRIKIREDLKRLSQALSTAKSQLAAAKTIPIGDYDKAVDGFMLAINASRQAQSVNVADAEADKKRAEAKGIEAEGAFELAKRALAANKYEVSDFMLKTAKGTGLLGKEIAIVRTKLDAKIAGESRYQKLFDAAKRALNKNEWVLAQANIKAALAEAEKSEFAGEDDVEKLKRDLEFAKVQFIHTDEVKTKTSEEMLSVLKRYDALTPTLQSVDHKNRAEDYRNTLRLRLGQVLVEEANEAEDLTIKGELLNRSLDYVEDKAVRTDIANQLTDIKVKLAIKNVDEGQVLLPRGTFLVGSNREEDSNPQRTFDQT